MTKFNQPKAMTRGQILDTFGESDRWRNPVRLHFMNDRWPKPQDDRDRAYERMLGLEKSGPSARKGP
jgi:hypothetical protein